MKKLKAFKGDRGFRLDSSWLIHLAACERCQGFDASNPVTAAAMCLEGAVLYKRDNVTAPKKALIERDEFYAPKSRIKALMRYKGDPV